MQLSAKQREFIDKLLALCKDYERDGVKVAFPYGLGLSKVEASIYFISR